MVLVGVLLERMFESIPVTAQTATTTATEIHTHHQFVSVVVVVVAVVVVCGVKESITNE